jgi:hypothetical protein
LKEIKIWHWHLVSQRQDLLKDDEQNDLFLGVKIESLGEVSEEIHEESYGGSRLG